MCVGRERQREKERERDTQTDRHLAGSRSLRRFQVVPGSALVLWGLAICGASKPRGWRQGRWYFEEHQNNTALPALAEVDLQLPRFLFFQEVVTLKKQNVGGDNTQAFLILFGSQHYSTMLSPS